MPILTGTPRPRMGLKAVQVVVVMLVATLEQSNVTPPTLSQGAQELHVVSPTLISQPSTVLGVDAADTAVTHSTIPSGQIISTKLSE
jgi:hypothetical protein